MDILALPVLPSLVPMSAKRLFLFVGTLALEFSSVCEGVRDQGGGTDLVELAATGKDGGW